MATDIFLNQFSGIIDVTYTMETFYLIFSKKKTKAMRAGPAYS